MSRRGWGGSGISIAVHAALLLAVAFAASRSSRIEGTPAIASQRTKFVLTVAPPGFKKAGGSNNQPGPLRAARMPAAQPLDTVAPQTITSAEPLPVSVVPVIATDDVERLPGSPVLVAGTAAGDGSGTGGGTARGAGNGSGDGPGAGEVYESGSGGVSAPSLIYEVKPQFTVDAMRAKIQGVVLMDVVVLANGSVDAGRIRITRSLDPGLDQQAVIAVRQWRFHPSRRLGQPVASRVTVELAFTLR